MRNIFIGFLLGIYIQGLAARSLDIAIQSISIRDLYAGSALAGLVSNNLNINPAEAADRSWKLADALMARRK